METKKPVLKILTDEKRTDYTPEQMDYIYEYCGNDMKKLKWLLDPIIDKIGGCTDKDKHDIYDLGMTLILDNVKRYDPNNANKASFYTFIWNLTKRRIFTTYVRDRNRQCRSNTYIKEKDGKKITVYVPDISLEALPQECIDYLDVIAQKKPLFEEQFVEEEFSPEMEKYLKRLSKVQRKILQALADDKSEDEIKAELHIDNKFYRDSIKAIYSNENIRYISKLRK